MVGYLTQVELEYPVRLFALILLVPIAIFAWRTMREVSLGRRLLAVLCRMSLVAALVFAWAGPFHRGQTSRKYIAFVVDHSQSSAASIQAAKSFIRDARGAGRGDVAELPFAGLPASLDQKASDELNLTGSDPARAILQAATEMPADLIGRVVLVSDGLSTQGDLLGAAASLQVPLDVVPMKAFADPEVCLMSANATRLGPVSTKCRVSIVVASNHADSGSVSVVDMAGKSLKSQKLKLLPGRMAVDLIVSCSTQDAEDLKISLKSTKDTVKANNIRHATVFPGEPLRVLISGSDSLTEQIGKSNELDAQSVALDSIKDTSTLAETDVLVLANILSSELPNDVKTNVENFVRNGGGLVVAGGKKVFAKADYQGSKFESWLPVKTAEEVEEASSTFAMVLIIDKSKSMLDGNRLSLAKDAAKRVVELLSPQDKVGVLAFGNDTQWISEISLCSDKPELKRRINTLTALGQTNMYPAIERTYLALEQADADHKHVILLTDGVSSPGDFDEIAAKMAKSGMTMSTVAISPEADHANLRDIARIAGGKFYPCDNPKDVETILVGDTKRVAKIEEPKALKINVLRALPGMPRLTNTVLDHGTTSPKTGAELLLVTETGDPLLAWWKFDAGVVVAVTADLSNEAFWQRVVKHAQPPAAPAQGRLSAKIENGKLTAWLDAFQSNGNLLTEGAVTFKVNDEPLEAEQVVAGRWQVELDANELGGYRIEAKAQLESQVIFHDKIAVWNDYPDELVLQETNEALLREAARLGGGNYDPKPADFFAKEDRSVSRETPLWPRLVRLAILLLLIDVGIRRAEFALLMGRKR